MFPNINAKQMQQAMKKMGVQQEEIDAVEVIIKCNDKHIVINNPSVQKVNMMGQVSYQISGTETVEAPEEVLEINEEDIQTVASQAGITEEEAIAALTETNGDIAEAILKMKK